MKKVKGMTRTMLAAAAVLLLGFAVSTSAVAQDTTSTAPQEMPATGGTGVDQLIGAIQDTEAQSTALGEITDLTVDRIQLVSVQDILTSQEEANAVNEVLTANGEKVMALQSALGANPVIQEALGENVSTQDVLAVNVLDDGSVIVFHQ